MPEYRIYRTIIGRIAGPPDVITADTDAEAIEKATQFMNGGSANVALWDGTRCVTKLETKKHVDK